MEPSPGERFEVDWGYGALEYSGDKRKPYAFALVPELKLNSLWSRHSARLMP